MSPFSDGIIPIPIRENVSVGIVHLPHDLTQEEADKICRIIVAHAKPKSGEVKHG